MKLTFYLLAAMLPVLFLLDSMVRLFLNRGSGLAIGERLVRWWGEERLFFAPLWARPRQKCGEWLAVAFLVLEFGWSPFTLLWTQLFPTLPQGGLEVGRSAVLCALVLAKVGVCTRFSGKQLAAGMLVVVLGLLVAPNVGTYLENVCYPICLIFLFKGVRLRGKLRVVLGILLADLAVHAVLVFSGLIPDVWNWLEVGGRTALGYGHPNVLGMAVLSIWALYTALRYEKWRWWDTVLGLAAAVFLYAGPRSRAAFAVVLFMTALTAVSRQWPGLFRLRFCRETAALCWPVLAAASLWMGANYGRYAFLEKLNAWFSSRLFLLHQVLTGPGWHWFGRPTSGTMNWGNAYDLAAWQADAQAGLVNYNFVDNGYGFALYMGGPIFLAALLVGYWVLIRRLLSGARADWGLAIVVIGYAFQCMMERTFVAFLPVILLGNVVFGKSQERPLTLAPDAPLKEDSI